MGRAPDGRPQGSWASMRASHMHASQTENVTPRELLTREMYFLTLVSVVEVAERRCVWCVVVVLEHLGDRDETA